MVELTYTGDEPFHDTRRNHIYHASTHDVPADAVDEYLAHDGWRYPDEDGPEAFDAVAFLDNDWRDVVGRIEAGDADGHLDTLKAKEEVRTVGDGARTSVLEAIEARRDGGGADATTE